MPLRTHAVGAIAPAFTESGKKEKKPSVQAVQKQSFASKLEKIISSESRPIFLSIRASDQFIFATAAIGLFTSTFVHSILFPLSPFIISRINHDNNENVSSTMEATASSPFGGKSSVETSRETGILVALYAVGLLVGSPLFGWLGDKIRQRRIPMLLGISASIAANIMFMFAIAYWMLLLARFLQGVANACVWTMSLCLIADNWPESRLGLQMGKLMGFYPLGLVTGLPVGVLYARLGHQAPFIASMVLCGLDFFMRLVIVERCHSPKEWFIKPDTEAQNGNNTTQQHPSPEISTTHTNISSSCSHCGDHNDENTHTKTNDSQVTVSKLLRRPRLLVSLHITLVVAAVMSSFESTLSMRLATEWHFDEAAIGLILLAYMVPSIAASAVAGWFCDKYGPKIVALVSIALVTPACIAIGLPDKNTPFWPLLLILIIGGTTMAGCQAPVFPEIAQVVANENKSTSKKDGLARSYGLFNAAYGTGMCFGPILAGFMYASIGFFWLCFILSMMFVVCFPFAYIYTGGDRRQLINRNHNADQIQVITIPSPASQTSIPTLFTNSNIHNERV